MTMKAYFQFALVVLIVAVAVQAQVTWSGNAGDSKFSTNGNWSSTPLNNGTETFQFSTSVALSPVIDTNFSISSLTFLSGSPGFTLGSSNGAVLTIKSSITQSSSSVQTISAPVTFNGTSATITNGGTLSLTSAVTNSATGGLTLGGTGTNGTISGAISGTGSLTKTDTGTWTLSNANSYGGGTTVNGGILTLATGGSLASTGTITVNATGSTNAEFDLGAGVNQTVASLTLGGAGATSGKTDGVYLAPTSTLTLTGGVTFDATNNPGQATISGGTLAFGSNNAVFNVGHTTSGDELFVFSTITGTGGLTKTGAGTLLMPGTNTYTGGTTVGQGTLTGTLPSGGDVSLNAAAAATAKLSVSATTQSIGKLTFSTLSSGTNLVDINPGNTLRLGGDMTVDTNAGATNQIIASSGSGTLNLGTGAGTFNITTNNALSVSTAVTGNTGLAKTGGGTLTLSGSNTFNGGLTINAGQVSVAGDTNLGATGGALTLNNGVLITTADMALGSARAVSLTGPGNGLSPAGNTTLTVSNAISGNGNLAKFGAGTLLLSGANTFTGTTTVVAGTLQLGNSSALQSSTLNYSNQGGTLSFGSLTSATFGALSGSQSLALTNTASGSVALTIGSSNTNATYSGVLSGGGSLTKIGNGTLTLSSTNTYTGGTTFSGGTLSVGSDSNLGGTGTLTFTGGALAANASFTSNRAVTLSASGTIDTGTNNVTLSGILSGSGVLNKGGTGTLTLTGTSNGGFTGGINVAAGTLSDGTTTGAFPNSIPVGMQSGATLLVNQNETVRQLNDLSGSGGTVSLPNGTSTLTLNGANGSTFSGTITGAGGVRLSGGAFLVLSGNSNTYGGSITIDNSNPQSVLQIGNGGATGSLTGAITDNGILNFNRSDGYTFSSSISGTGFVGQNGSGTLILAGANSYSGKTQVSQGGTLADTPTAASFSPNSIIILTGSSSSGVNGAALNVNHNETIAGLGDYYGTGTTVSFPTVNLASGTTLTIVSSGPTYNGTISGAGNVTVSGNSNQTFNGSSGYTGVTKLTGGLQLNAAILDNIGSNSSIGKGDATSAATNAASLILDGGSALAYTGAGASTDRLFNLGSGGGKIYASGTGSLNFTNTGSIAYNTTGNSSLVLGGFGSTTNTFAPAIGNTTSGNVSLFKSGPTYGSSPTWVLTGANTYSGSTVINNGILRIGADNTLPITTRLKLVDSGSFFNSSAPATLDVANNQQIGGFDNSGNSGGGNINFGNGTSITIAPSKKLTVSPTSVSSSAYAGTISGNGALTIGGVSSSSIALTGANSFGGGTTVNTGATLLVDSNNGAPLGSGSLTLQDSATFGSVSSKASLSNAVTIAGPGVTFGASGHSGQTELKGNVSITNATTTMHLMGNQPTIIDGGSLTVPSGTTLTFDSAGGSFGLAGLAPTSFTGSIATLTANNAGVVIGSSGVLAGVTQLRASSGYLGVTFAGSGFLGKIDKLNFTGTVGFDSIDQDSSTTSFNDVIDLTLFNPAVTIGSVSSAILTGTITPQGTNYQFGNGGGGLVVQSALVDGTAPSVSRGVSVNSTGNIAGGGLFAIFQGTNTYTGNLTIANSGVILDSATALPAGSKFTLGANSYLGYTENFTGVTSFANLLATRLNGYDSGGTSVLGFDSHQFISDEFNNFTSSPAIRIIVEPLNLGSLGQIYVGTVSQAALYGSIVAPNNGGNLSLAALGEHSQLTVGSRLLAGHVASLTVGLAGVDKGTVLLGGANTFTGGTTLLGGELSLALSSKKNSSGSIVAGPLGTGPLSVPVTATKPVLAASNNGMNYNYSGTVLHNDISLATMLQVGTPEMFGDALVDSIGNPPMLILNGAIGNISGAIGSLDVQGPTVLNGANSFSGGVTLHDTGFLQLGTDTALGTGPLTFSSFDSYPYFSLSSSGGPRTLNNPLVFNNSTVYAELSTFGPAGFTFNGTVSLNGNAVSFSPGQFPMVFNGAINGPGRVEVYGNSAIVLKGTNNTYGGGTEAYSGGVIFGSATSIPTAGGLQADSSGYIGLASPTFTGGQNVQTAFLNRFNQSGTNGTIGFDTLNGAPTDTFADAINLSGFNSNVQLGSATSAILTGAITPANSYSYNFGGGGGFLQINSALPNLVVEGYTQLKVSSPSDHPLTLRLAGANSYKDRTIVASSALIFAAGALPDGTNNFYPDWSESSSTAGYIGSEDSSNISTFLAHFPSSLSQGFIGFDTAPAGSPFTITGLLDFSRFNSGVYLSSTTNLVLSSTATFTPPISDSAYRFAGYKGGRVEVDAKLTGSRSVVVGSPDVPASAGSPTNTSAISTVVLDDSARSSNPNDYFGGTTLYTGALLLGSSSTLSGSTIISGPLGTAALTVSPVNSSTRMGLLPPTAQLGASTGGISVANAINLNADLTLIGSPSFTLSGAITGSHDLVKSGTGTVTLSGNNSAFNGDIYISQGTLAFGTANSFGTGSLAFGISPSIPTASFLASTTINGLSGDNTSDLITLGNGVTLTINQPVDSQYPGTFSSTGGSLVFGYSTDGSPSHLALSGNSSAFSGSTTINSGIVVLAQNNGAFGPAANTVTLNGGKLAVDAGTTLTNALALTNGALGGSGTFQPPATLTIGGSGVNHVTLAPGVGGPGLLTFSGALLGASPVLTLSGGGAYNWQLADAINATSGWDMITVTGTVNIGATTASPFTFKILPILPTDANGNSFGLVPLNFSPANSYSWTVLTATSITGTFNASAFSFDTSAFAPGALGIGSFFVTQNGSSLLLNFTPVPEPSTFALLAAGLAMLLGSLRRRKA